jgi:hypothetical protein
MFDQIARKYGVMNYAMGGPVKMAEGGLTPEQYQSINAYLATNPSAEALASAQQQYGVSDADLAVARQFANVGAAPGTPGMDTSQPVVGGGGYDTRPTVSAGTIDQGYSQNYSPEQVQAIRAGFLDNRNDPQKMMGLMTQYGVNVKDIATAMGGSEKGYQNIFLQAGAAPSFGGMDDYQATSADKAYLDNMLQSANPFGQGTLADVYRNQGIDPYTDPRVLTQAREENEREARRNQMRASAGAGPAPAPGGGGSFTPPSVYQPQAPFTRPDGSTIYPNSIQTPQGPQPTYFPTSWWTSSPSASKAYGQTAPSTARDFDAEMVDYRAKYAPVFTRPAPPPPIPVPAASTPGASADKPPTQDPGPGMEWKWTGTAWVVQPVVVPDTTSGLGYAKGGEVNTLWKKYHGR